MSEQPTDRATIPRDAPGGPPLGDPARLRAPARLARNAVELVLHEVATLPLSPSEARVIDTLQEAIGTLYVSLDAHPESNLHLDSLQAAAGRIDEARALLPLQGQRAELFARAAAILGDTVGIVREQVDELMAATLFSVRDPRRYRRVDEAPKATTEQPFLASIGEPQLHALARPRLRTLLPVPVEVEQGVVAAPPPRIPVPRTLDELRGFAEANQSGALAASLSEPAKTEQQPDKAPVTFAFTPSVEEQQVVRTLARDALEDIAGLSLLRKPIPTETWLDQAPFEQRLLDNLDYFVSLGAPALEIVPLYHAEAKVPDAARGFATAFALGCVDGRDAVGLAIAVLKESAPEEHPGWVEGLTLAPHPAIDEMVADLLLDKNAGLVGVAIDVLGARGTLPSDVVEWVRERKDPALMHKLVVALASALPTENAIAALEPLTWEKDDVLFEAAAVSLLRRGHGSTRDRLRDAIADTAGSPLRAARSACLLAVTGTSDDFGTLMEAAQRFPTPALARALGRHGHVRLVPVLIDMLGLGDEVLAEAAGEALDRITAANLRHVVEEPWETGLPEALRGDAEKVGAIQPMRRVEKVILDPEAWKSWAKEHLDEFDARRKHRGGRPFEPMFVLDELEATATPPARRAEATFEVACMLGARVRFRPDDWVARQRRHLAHLRSELGTLDTVPGTWVFARSTSPRDAAHWSSPPRGR